MSSSSSSSTAASDMILEWNPRGSAFLLESHVFKNKSEKSPSQSKLSNDRIYYMFRFNITKTAEWPSFVQGDAQNPPKKRDI